jgi:hypothetical protein
MEHKDGEKEPLVDKETRNTFILKESTLDKIRHIAYWERLNQKDVYTAALEEYITRYEQEHGTIPPRK